MPILSSFAAKAVITFFIAFVICLIAGPILIPVLHRLKFGQEIREEGPAWHKKKSGTPTMGGLIFIIGATVATLVFARDLKTLLVLSAALLFGIIGFIDDFIKVILKRNLGLTASQKFLAQILVATVYAVVIYRLGLVDDKVILPFCDAELSLWYFYVPVTVFIIAGFVNAVNLTDGLDGLASSVTAIVSLFFAFAAYVFKNEDLAHFCIALFGGCIGFLVFNHYPAKIFMGDTGSLFLGGAVSAAAVMLKMPIILVIAGLIYVIEALSVMLQVAYFKKTGKRIFKMSPIHHHFEMCGYSEVKIVTAFSAFTLAACVIAAAAIIL